ncbi:porin, partial [Rivihabitans pingtungensis]|uniref:porin n=1 Tax=Rivihabitans pingtungensis TaxID=1054498 RepID=UPI0028A2958F
MTLNRTLLALTLSGLSTAALADVTLYGAIDETLESVSARGAADSARNIGQTTRVTSNSSLIGFKGSEDLGNGLKAIWQVESGLAID